MAAKDEFVRVRSEEALKFFIENIEEIVPPKRYFGPYVLSNSPEFQMKKLFELAKLGMECERWLKRIKELEDRLQTIRDISEGK